MGSYTNVYSESHNLSAPSQGRRLKTYATYTTDPRLESECRKLQNVPSIIEAFEIADVPNLPYFVFITTCFFFVQHLPGVAVFLTQLLWLQFSDTFGRPVTGRREQRNYSATSDQGTGDEATLPRTEERPAKKKSGIRRSRSTTRSNQSSTPNVPTQPNKKQLFPGRKSGEKRSGGERRGVECE